MADPYRITIPEGVIEDLRARLRSTRWPEPATAAGWEQGVPLDWLRELCRYWEQSYDWAARVERLNLLPHFRSVLDGLGIHFVHVRSPQPHAVPLVITHGWPGAVTEFVKVLGPLTDPASFGGDPDDAFHVVCPSLPGFGWSDKPTRTGWGVERIADAWAALMTELGYDRFGAQGGDWGAGVTRHLGTRHAERVLGVHLNMVVVTPDLEALGELTDRERSALDSMKAYADKDSGYLHLQATRPQTVGYALTDSPVGQCAWIVEKLHSWTDCDGDPLNILSPDEILDDVMVYWATASGASSARLYWESYTAGDRGRVTVPAGCSIFPKEIIRPSRRWAEKDFADLRWWDEPARGGHFPALEQPEIFVDQVRSFFRLIR